MHGFSRAHVIDRLNASLTDIPDHCPILNPAPDGALKYVVPPDLRGVLAAIVESRVELNAMRYPNHQYFSISTDVEHAYVSLVHALRIRTALPLNMVIEFHADWVFSVTTLDTLRADYERNKKPPEEEKPSGLSYAYRDQPPEVAHFRLLSGGGIEMIPKTDR